MSGTRLEPFRMERWQSLHEHQVDLNLSESGVQPLSVAELLALPGAPAPDPREITLGYPQTNGIEQLREHIAALYPGAGIANVLVTHGGSEANLLSAWHALDGAPDRDGGDEAVVLVPNYLQTLGLAEGFGVTVRPWLLEEERDWLPDPARLDELVGERTRLIVITTPNNPVGRTLPGEILDAVITAAERVGAWVLSDEIYRGAEHADVPTSPSLWGRGQRLLVTSGLSKAYGLPGLRTGWIACPDAGAVEELWARKDYSSITSSPITQTLAACALEPTRRAALLARTAGILRENLALARDWVASTDGAFTAVEPDASAILWLRSHLPLPTEEMARRLLAEESVLIVPGPQFEPGDRLANWWRLGFGDGRAHLEEGLARVGRFVERVRG